MESLSIAFTPSPSYTNAEASVDWKRQRRVGWVGLGGATGSGAATIAANDMKWRRQPCAHGRLQSRPLAPRFKVPRLLLQAKNVFWKKIIAGND